MIALRRPTLLLALAALVAATVAATPAQAAKRKVPFGFFGTVLQPELAEVSDSAFEGQMSLMARSGVESVRAIIPWSTIEPTQGAYDWTGTDRLVSSAATHHLEILANVMDAPDWAEARRIPRYPTGSPPKSAALYAGFVRQAVLRYGPNGSFWAQNPTVPRVPIHNWQIWNEQMAPWFWSQRPWGPSYTRVLKAAYQVIHKLDRKATVVAGSFVAVAHYTQWRGVSDLYRAGAKRYFDEIAVHPFTNVPNSVRYSIDQMLEIVKRVRAQMRKRGDGRKPIILTELTWPAAVGKVPKRRLLGLETTTRGQIARLKAAYHRLASVRRQIGITQAYWFSWATQYDARSSLSDVSYRFAGLTRRRGNVFSKMPILRTYTNVAAQYEGCRKSADARRCR
jgi:polysaccharide biosynthesis protein PslG